MWRRLRFPLLYSILLLCVACTPVVGIPPTRELVPTSEVAAGQSAPAIAASATRLPTVTTVPASPTTAPPTATTPATTTPEPFPTVVATGTPQPSPTTAPPLVLDPALAAELQRILDETVADGHIPGAVLSVSMPGYEPWNGASGLADPADQQPMETTTRVRIASISKIFTAVVVLQLVEEARIELDAPVATWLPGLLPAGEQITVRQLLQHTSGIYDYLEDYAFREQAYQTPDRSWTPAELVAYAVSFAPLFSPGAAGAWDYSSTNYVILGMLVEQVTGRSLADEMRWRIFDPLALEGTFFQPDEAVQGYQAAGFSEERNLTNAPMSFAFGTANLVSTADDVRRFALALFSGELLQPATMDMMLTFVGGHGSYNMPELAYGLGLMRNRLPVDPGPDGQARPPAASTVFGHTGGYAGFRSVVWHAPDGAITIALGLNQSATDPNTLATRVLNAILAHQGR